MDLGRAISQQKVQNGSNTLSFEQDEVDKQIRNQNGRNDAFMNNFVNDLKVYQFIQDFDQETLKFNNNDLVKSVMEQGQAIITVTQDALEIGNDDLVSNFMN